MIIGLCGFDFFLSIDIELHLLFKGKDRKILMACFFIGHQTLLRLGVFSNTA